MKSIFILLFCFYTTVATSYEIRIHPVNSWQEIDTKSSQKILVESFMDGYEDVPLVELNPAFESIGDVRRFYEAYFFEEYERFKNDEVLWVEAYVDDVLAGWATFELEQNETNAAYMVLLTVSPHFQRLGLGKALTFSIRERYPHLEAINLLIRKVNKKGYSFYYSLGFFDYDYNRPDNFVDRTLLTGLRWSKN
ncbi:MAG: GNAT family N-acetyltransferase [Verrucomicrobia bacterium]|nr:GNAT family N-acetyltransferase [Verrucomicrobiota bacterium]